MKKVPNYVWGFSLFILVGSMMVYQNVNSEEKKYSQSTWTSITEVRDKIQRRNIELKEGETWSDDGDAYEMELMRLKNIEAPSQKARYILRFDGFLLRSAKQEIVEKTDRQGMQYYSLLDER